MAEDFIAPVFEAKPTEGAEWWRGAAIYQIYPRSYFDSNNDGVGDLQGIVERLDHIAWLGVDAIWVSPFFKSPMADFGYDVADYCDVDPVFGNLQDFDRLIVRAHELGLKVMIDIVMAHTSDQHPWFVSSRMSECSPHADWYVWRDAKADGTPPNNWQSVFGGPAWTWDARRGKYYMHQFLKQQPQLNCHNRAVQDALLAVLRFWLDRGVDGFRIDALNHSMFDLEFRSNPPALDNGKIRSRPYDFQDRKFSMSHPGVIEFVERIRGVCDEYDAIFTLAEIGGENTESEMKAYTAGQSRLNSAYGFDFLYARSLTAEVILETLSEWSGEPDPDGRAQGWPSWAFENHDSSRASYRWVDHDLSSGEFEAFLRMKMALLLCLRGNVILFQGEEIGQVQDEIPFELLKDPEAIANWPLTLSRDGVRTPLSWEAELPNAGFSRADPWLPLSSANVARAISAQQTDPESLLNFTKQMIALRRRYAELSRGGLKILRASGDLLIFERMLESGRVHLAFNLGGKALNVKLPEGEEILSVNDATAKKIPPWGARIVRID